MVSEAYIIQSRGINVVVGSVGGHGFKSLTG